MLSFKFGVVMMFFWRKEKKEVDDYKKEGWQEESVLHGRKEQKPIVRIFTLSDVKNAGRILDFVLGNNIAIINIAPLKFRNTFELKYAVNKIKKGVEGKGDIAGIEGGYIIVTGRNGRIGRKR